MIVREVHSAKVAVIGAVRTPGRYEVKSPATVLELIALAQGFTDFASRDRIVVLRRNGAHDHAHPLQLPQYRGWHRAGQLLRPARGHHRRPVRAVTMPYESPSPTPDEPCLLRALEISSAAWVLAFVGLRRDSRCRSGVRPLPARPVSSQRGGAGGAAASGNSS